MKFKFKQYCFIVFIFCSTLVVAQNVEVKYVSNRIIDKEKFDQLLSVQKPLYLQNTFTYTLKIKDQISIYKNDDFSKIDIDMEKVLTGDDNIYNKYIYDGITRENLFRNCEYIYYKNFKDNVTLIEIGRIPSNGYIKDELIDWKWGITDEKQIILGYTCKKAISNIYDMKFEAWFTDEVPVSSGPLAYNGLPGLILKVSTPNTTIDALSITFPKKMEEIVAPVFTEPAKTFVEYYKLEKYVQPKK